MCKNLLFDTCMLTGSGNRLLYPSCTKLLRRQVFREFYRSQAGLNIMHACLISSLIVHDFSNKKLKKLYPDLKFISHFIRNISDLKLKMLFLICGTLL